MPLPKPPEGLTPPPSMWDQIAQKYRMSVPALVQALTGELFPAGGPPTNMTEVGRQEYSGKPISALLSGASYGPMAWSPTFRKQADVAAQLPSVGLAAWKVRGTPATKVFKKELETAAVGSSGRPARLYHGTGTDVPSLDPNMSREVNLYGPGVYLTENPRVASGYAGKDYLPPRKLTIISSETWGPVNVPQERIVRRWVENTVDQYGVPSKVPMVEYVTKEIPARAPNIRPVNVFIKKPFDVDAPADPAILESLNEMWDKQHIGWAGDVLDEIAYPTAKKMTNDDLYRAIERTLGNGWETNDWLASQGFDGITHIGGKIAGKKPHRVWIAFNKEQVVPAFGGGKK